MGTLYENIKEACKRKGVTPSAMCLELGMSKSTMSELKSGRNKSLSTETLLKIANYLDVSTDTLLFDTEQKKAPILTKKDERDIAHDLEDILNEMSSGSDLMFDGNPLTDEARESIMAAMKLGLEAAKLKNKERFTPKKSKE